MMIRHALEMLIYSPSPAQMQNNSFKIQGVEEIGNFLVLQILYPKCPACTFEGLKTLVVEATIKQALFWRKADPHFREGPFLKNEMPSPAAIFPSTPTGLADAIAFAKYKNAN